MSVPLSTGAVKALFDREYNPNFQPILQILQAAVAQPVNGGNPRWKLSVSDGVHWMTAILAVQLNELVTSGKIAAGSIARITQFNINQNGDRKLILISQIEPLASAPERIGSPVKIEAATANGGKGEIVQSNSYQPQPQVQKNLPPNPMTMSAPKKTTFPSPSPSPIPAPQSENGQFHPIKSLNPYQTRWTIKARVTFKGEMRTYNGAKGQGKFLNVDLVDSQGGEIRVTMFNEAADKFFPVFEVNRAFIVSKGNLKPSTKKGGPQKHPYEIYLDSNSVVQLCTDPVDIPKTSYHFTPLQNLQDVQPDETVDVLGVVIDMGSLVNFTSKAGKPLTKRTLTLLDTSSRSVELTIWGAQAENPYSSDSPSPIIAVKNAKVSSFNARSLTMGQNSSIEVDPDLREAHELKGWYQVSGPNAVIYPLSVSSSVNTGKEEVGTGQKQRNFPLKTFGQVKDENLGRQIGKTDFADCKGTVSLIKHENTLWYPACTLMVNGKPCNKKVVDQGNGSWKCERCGVAFNNKSLRYILTLAAADQTGNIWLQCFNDVAEKILQRSADEVSTLKETSPAAFEAVFAEATFKQYKFKIKAATETYQDESRVRYNVLSATPLEFADYSRYLLDEIKKF